jgi:hypothetical protein
MIAGLQCPGQQAAEACDGGGREKHSGQAEENRHTTYSYSPHRVFLGVSTKRLR